MEFWDMEPFDKIGPPTKDAMYYIDDDVDEDTIDNFRQELFEEKCCNENRYKDE